MQKENVYIIIPVYNRKETTLQCLEKLSSFGYLKGYKIVVVDDASTDGTSEAIRLAYPEVDVLAGSGDLWWTGAMVMGMKHAYDNGASYCVWLNDDCLIEAQTLPSMVDFAKSHPNTIVGPSCYHLKEGAWTHKTSGSSGRKRFSGEDGEVTFVEALAGWCVLIPTTVIREIGLPDMQRFPHYEADNMYTLKATRAGFRACVLRSAKAKVLGTLGKKHPRRDFTNYFTNTSKPIETLSSLFFSKKSPYRFSSQFFYHIERHGYLFGIPFFIAKVTIWLLKWAKFQFLPQQNSESLGA